MNSTLPVTSVIAGALLILASLASCHRAGEPAPATVAAAPVKVRVAAVEMSSAAPAIRVPGILARQTEAELSFPVGGMIQSIRVRAGDRVAEKQELARLQTDQFQAQVLQATVLLDKARRDLDRIEKLHAERVATLENLQDARTDVARAEAGLRMAEFNRAQSIITAPAEGVVLRRLAEPNELVAPGRPVLTFATDRDGWIVRCGLTPRDAARTAPGDRVEFTGAPGQVSTGKVTSLGETMDPATGTVLVEAALDTRPTQARSGQIVSLAITPKPVAPRAVVPLAALRDGTGMRATLLLVSPGASSAKRFAVEIEEVDQGRVYLRTAVPPGAQVIVSGGQFVREGAALTVTEEGPGATAR